MSQVDYKFIRPIPSVSPVNAPVAANDTLLVAINKLQGQIDAAGTHQEVFIGTPGTLPTYPAIVFVASTISGRTIYKMQVNVP